MTPCGETVLVIRSFNFHTGIFKTRGCSKKKPYVLERNSYCIVIINFYLFNIYNTRQFQPYISNNFVLFFFTMGTFFPTVLFTNNSATECCIIILKRNKAYFHLSKRYTKRTKLCYQSTVLLTLCYHGIKINRLNDIWLFPIRE